VNGDAALGGGARIAPEERPREDDAVGGVVAGRLEAATSSSGTSFRASAGVMRRVGTSQRFCSATFFSMRARVAAVRARKR